MKLLLYAVLRNSEKKIHSVNSVSTEVFFISNNNLTAIISACENSATPSIEQLLSFEKVVADFHREHTVIPMRYGCLFDNEAQLMNFLTKHQAQYETLLDELEDCVEMGLRFLISVPQAIGNIVVSEPEPVSSGRAYLAARRRHYEDPSTEFQAMMTEVCAPLDGLFKRQKTEVKRFEDGWLCSQYFLLRRTEIEAWNDKLRHLIVPQSVKLSASGPWPPYNFVMTENSPAAMLLPKLK